ncbi:MAG TPA: hypothetical protein VF627_11910 [Abditibacterium sp.]
MFHTNFLVPVAVRYEDERAQPRLIVVGPDLEAALRDFCWANHPPRATDMLIDSQRWPAITARDSGRMPQHFPEVSTCLCDVRTRQPIYWQLRQPHVDFLFTTSGRSDDLWWAWTVISQTQGAVIGLQRLDFGAFPSVWQTSIGQLLPNPIPHNPDTLRVLVSDPADFEFWNAQPLPFQIRWVEESE